MHLQREMEKNNSVLNNLVWLWGAIVATVLTSIVLWILFKVEQLAPFGNNSLAIVDAKIQYLDFFSYLKDVIEGKAGLNYSFGKSLGGTNIALFSYYLSSPFNFLVRYWDKENLNTFFDIAVLLKLSLCAGTCSTFLKLRFCELKNIFVVLLGFSYAMMQYNFAQSSNIMWLDGVYMLPLILLGVYYLVNKNSGFLLSISVGLAILFNWYSAGIDCLFSIFWCGIELLYKYKLSKDQFKFICKTICLYGLHMTLGVGISTVLFLPTIFALREGKGTFDWDNLFSGFTGNILTMIQNFTIGSTSSKGSVSLFCGSFVVIGVIAYFIDKNQNQREKKINVFVSVVTVLFFYFMPLCFVFSLFKTVRSYWYRYSYIGIWVLVFIAAFFYSRWSIKGAVKESVLKKSGLGFSIVLLALDFANRVWKINQTYITVIFYVLITYVLVFLIQKRSRIVRGVLLGILCICIIGDMSYNAHNLIKSYRACDVNEYRSYIKDQRELVKQVKKYDSDFYRINQTLTRNMTDKNLTANYNEALAFNYNSIASYTSAPENRQLSFLENLGYKETKETLNIVNTSIIPADSLLGVKYVFSHETINGLKIREDSLERNKKRIYENPYCLPNAFIYNPFDDSEIAWEGNPFLFQNMLYSKLVGREVELYKKLSFTENREAQSKRYVLSIPDKEVAVYGNLKTSKEIKGKLYVDDQFRTAYSEWLAPSVFYVPYQGEKETVEVSLHSEENLDNITDAQFYYVDLNEFQNLVDELKKQKVDTISITPGKIYGNVQGEKGELLYLNIPYHEQWTVTCNGMEVTPVLFGDCLMSIPLQNGENEVMMVYHVKGLKEGVIISLLSISLLFYIMRRRLKKCFQ